MDKEIETVRIRKNVFVENSAMTLKSTKKTLLQQMSFLRTSCKETLIFSLFWSANGAAPSLIRQSKWIKTEDNVGLLEIKDYESWWSNVGKKTRNMVRKAEKSGIKVLLLSQARSLLKAFGKSTMKPPSGKDELSRIIGSHFKPLLGTFMIRKKLHFHRRISCRKSLLGSSK